jgi:succinate dehydrogenase/fumarate reductase flavoprotein subunit
MVRTEGKVVECDVLVIGGGLAGAYAALRAKDFADKVVLVDKGRVSRSGASPLAGGFIECITEKDDPDLWMKDLVETGEYMNDQDWVKIVWEEGIKRIKEIDSLGPVIDKDEKGNFKRWLGRGGMVVLQVIFDARKTMEILRGRLEAKGVTIIDRTMVTDLLTGDGAHPTQDRVVGAVGFNTRTAEPAVFKARAVVMATGVAGGLGSDLIWSGDGYGQAWRVGAELYGMEFPRWWGNWNFGKRVHAGHLCLWAGLRWRLTNGRGERFMQKMLPDLEERGDFQYLTAGLGKVYLEGTGPIYADFTHASPEEWEWARRSYSQEHVIATYEKAGIDLHKQKVTFDFTPGWIMITAGGNGIPVNTYCESNIPGLFACGQAGGYPHEGTHGGGGGNILGCLVMGYRAGEYAAKYAKEGGEIKINDNQVKSLQKAALEPLKTKKGVKPWDIRKRFGKLMSQPRMAFFRHEKRINEALKELEKCEAMLPDLYVETPQELMRANGLKSCLQNWRFCLTASLARKETRGANLREDYPFTDNINHLKWFILGRGKNNDIEVKVRGLPFYRWPVKPKHEIVPYPIQFPKIEA